MNQISFRNHAALSALMLGLITALAGGRAVADQTNDIATLDISQVRQGWGEPRANKSVAGNTLSIGGRKFEHGLGTHASSEYILDLNRQGASFTGWVGVDDEVGSGKGAVEFKLMG